MREEVMRNFRAGEEGVAVTLVGERERRKFKYIEDFLGKPVERGELPEELRADAPDADRKQPRASEPKTKGRADKPRRRFNRRRPKSPKPGKPDSPAGI